MASDPRALTLRHDAVSWAPTDEDLIVVLDLRTSKYLSLNPSGSVLWQLLADGSTEPDLRAALADRFGLDDAKATADVDAFLGSLRGRDLLIEE